MYIMSCVWRKQSLEQYACYADFYGKIIKMLISLFRFESEICVWIQMTVRCKRAEVLGR